MEKSNILIGSDFAAVHAYLCADGYVCKNLPSQKTKYYRIGLRNTCPELLEDFQTRFDNVFHKKPIISKQQDRCLIGSRELFYFLTENFGSFYSADWSIPKCLVKKELLSSWLRAFFDCEGWVEAVKGKNRAVAAESINEKGLNDIRNYLKNLFGIHSTIRPRSGRTTSVLGIYGKKNIIKFSNQIGFTHPLKRQKLDAAINSFVNYDWQFPENEQELKDFVTAFLKQRINLTTGRIQVCSNKKKNIIKLSKLLKRFASINCRVSKTRFNSFGTRYFELSINKKQDVTKLKELIL